MADEDFTDALVRQACSIDLGDSGPVEIDNGVVTIWNKDRSWCLWLDEETYHKMKQDPKLWDNG